MNNTNLQTLPARIASQEAKKRRAKAKYEATVADADKRISELREEYERLLAEQK